MSDADNIQGTDETPSIPTSGVGQPVNKQVITDDVFEEAQIVAPEPEEEKEEPVETDSSDETGQENKEEEEHLLFDVEPNKLTIDPTRPIYVRIDPEEKGIAALSVLPTTREDAETFVNSLSTVGEEDLEWVLTTRNATDNAYLGNGLLKAAIRKGAKWKGQLENPVTPTPLCDYRSAYKIFDQPATRISGADAIDMFTAGTNLGRPVTVPLWHSGFWVKLRAPSAAFLADIDRALAFSREELGLEVFGAIGANDRLIFDEILVDAALKLVSETNIAIAKSPMELKEVIDYFDIDSLIWGMAQAAFPDGCEIAIPCPSCRGVTHVKANLLRMRFVDESRLTQVQIRQMAKGIAHKTTVEELKKYKEEFEILNTQKWEWNKRTFTFRSPTIEEYLTSGREYITSVSRALTETLRDDVTDDYRRGQSMKSILTTEETARFLHFIREIKIPNTNEKGSADNYGIVNDPHAILDIMRYISGDYEASDGLIVAINDFINDAINTIIGFPNVNCPACGKFYLSKTGEETIIVPFNPATGFFILAQHKIREAGSEPLTNLLTLGLTGLLSKVSASEAQG
ncbi:hypothetical protein MOC16_gp029 [Klebsiella phage vB_KpM_FBKp24]|uniref:Uncharacterized protein n=1 Tax=Klebsiella phage vB_KpM_FBKp24 TaxID=2801834 RepID=A0A7U0GB91_9CAUD|nr:hypothetical protein MOC16_gp029 [Klebsiella phage vB_KpM_FBKp24]QQV92026.1 hypothetical protein vBKpMFBKp24_029 [Klebsiella phage vB_KpM_FBKp24]